MPSGHPTALPVRPYHGSKRYRLLAAREMTAYVVYVPRADGAPELAAVKGRACGREFRTDHPTAAFDYRVRIPIVEIHPSPQAAVDAFVKQCREMVAFHASNQQTFHRRAELAAAMKLENVP